MVHMVFQFVLKLEMQPVIPQDVLERVCSVEYFHAPYAINALYFECVHQSPDPRNLANDLMQ